MQAALHVFFMARLIAFDEVWYQLASAFFEFSSCILEVQIAMGFAAACSGRTRLVNCLLFLIPLGILVAALLTFVWNSTDFSGTQWTQDSDRFWSFVVLWCCGLAILFYSCSILQTAGKPRLVRRRTRLRGLSYTACFILTLGPMAVAQLSRCFRIYPLAINVLYLNGAVNAGAYMFWMVHASRRHRSSSSELESLEESLVDAYFELYYFQDVCTVSMMRSVALSAAEARDLRDETPVPEILKMSTSEVH
mmetsp:Transcript_27124/g.49371  ORF Transcript_27124/g.49371 Transcript_27124/m.49371 type:complete len:250 (-) Transcript_27124:90-839(-)